MSLAISTALTVLAQGTPDDCGGLQHAIASCHGNLLPAALVTAATVAVTAAVGGVVASVLFPQIMNTISGVDSALSASGSASAADAAAPPSLAGAGAPSAGAPSEIRAGSERIPVLPTTGPSVPFAGRVLLVGEGNFSFTASNLALGRNVPANVTTTAYSPDGQYSPDALARAEELRRAGVDVRLGVDARALPTDLAEGASFDNVIFQFPHPGTPRSEVPQAGRSLLEGFFASASQRLSSGGQVTLTLKSQFYVSQWKPLAAAKGAGLQLVSVTEFQQGHYPGYGHVTTSAGARTPDVSRGVTFVFRST